MVLPFTSWTGPESIEVTGERIGDKIAAYSGVNGVDRHLATPTEQSPWP